MCPQVLLFTTCVSGLIVGVVVVVAVGGGAFSFAVFVLLEMLRSISRNGPLSLYIPKNRYY